MSNCIPHHINGQALESLGPKITIYNPNNGQEVGYIHVGDTSIIRQAIDYAQKAQPTWAATPALKRAKLLRQYAHIIEKRGQELAMIVSQEHGKTLSDASASIQRGLELIHYHCAIAQQLQGPYSPHVSHQIHSFTQRFPLGICAGIAPFNFPVMVPLWLMIPAIACGNAFILKPSEKTPSASLLLLQWLEEAGLPPGIVQCIQGDASTVQLLLEQDEIQAYSAVGSTKAAQHIYVEAAKRGKRAATFGGAKNHALVMPDANLEQAADSIVSAAYGSSGQRCMAISVVMTLDASCHEKLVKLILARLDKIKLGESSDKDADMGPLNSRQQLDFLLQSIQEGIDDGAELIYDGRQIPSPHPDGFFLGPCLFDKVTTAMNLYQKELFGPILVLLKVKDFSQALETIAQNPYGNGAIIFTQNGATSDHFVQSAQAGMIGVNLPIPVPIVSHPFGGWKLSSFGAHGMHGEESLHFYSKHKSITVTWPQENLGLSLNMPHL